MPRSTDQTLQRDREAWELRDRLNLDWATIARTLGFTQESVARASARRHARRLGIVLPTHPNRRLAGQRAANQRHGNRRPTSIGTRTFGVEIEFKTAPKFFVAREIANALGVSHIHSFAYHQNRCETCHQVVPSTELYSQWKLEKDGSVTDIRGGVQYGGEVVSPILSGDTGGFEEIKKVTKAMKLAGATVNRRCGLHVHISVRDFNNVERGNIVRLWQHTERVIENFVATSRIGNYYCSRWNNAVRPIEDLERGRALNYNKMQNLNIAPYDTPKKTFEVRLHQGTLSGVKITTWVRFLLAFFTNAASTANVADHGVAELPIQRIAEVRPVNGRENFNEEPLLDVLCGKGFLTPRDSQYLKERADGFKERMVS